MKVRTLPSSGAFQTKICVPGDKSISHRSIILSSIAEGSTEIKGFLMGEDCLATIVAMRSLGIDIVEQQKCLIVHGTGKYGLKSCDSDINLGNSGTSMRLLTGLLAAQKFASMLTGDESLSQRPMLRIAIPLTQMGANVFPMDDGTPPIKIAPTDELQGIRYNLPVASAQVKSGILLAALYAQCDTVVIEPEQTRDHTEIMLRKFSVKCTTENNVITLASHQNLVSPEKLFIPGDISSAAFFIVATLISQNSILTIRDVGINPTRIAILKILQQMNADITIQNTRDTALEPIADIVVKSSDLKGYEVPPDLIANAVDELPILAIAANFASGNTVVKGAKELRFKESDRINSIVKGLRSLGGSIEEFNDGFEIKPGVLKSGRVDSFCDHRIAMAFIIAGLRVEGSIEVLNCQNIKTSFPNFLDLCKQLGIVANIE